MGATDYNHALQLAGLSASNHAKISRAALRHNLQVIQQHLQQRCVDTAALGDSAAGSKLLAVVKADAYGHGLIAIAEILQSMPQQVAGLAVAKVAGAILLRQHGCKLPIVCLSGFEDQEQLDIMRQMQVTAVVHSAAQLAILESHSASGVAPLKVWLKLDSGMHRLGFYPASLPSAWQRLRDNPEVDTSDAVLMSHLAISEQPAHELTQHQYQIMAQVTQGLDCATSMANSAAIWDPHTTHHPGQWVRPGLAMYGLSPLPQQTAAELNLKPVMTLISQLIAVKTCPAGGTIGYGGYYQAPENMPIGVVGLGYADGYPRELSAYAVVLVHGQRCPVIGRVSMDMLHIDLRPCVAAGLQAQPGDEVVLWGDGLPLEELAAAADTIAYTVLTRLGPRVQRVLVD